MEMEDKFSHTPEVSVIVPCRNEFDQIESCLRSIINQQEPPGGLEIVIVDGMSDDGTRDILKNAAEQDSRIRLVDNPARITPCGMNCGIRAARGRWIARMDAHSRYAPDYLVRCLEVTGETGADNVGGSVVTEGHTRIQKAIAAAHHSPFSVGGARWHNPDYEGKADTVFGGFYKREIFERIGFFDEELVRNQDDELNLRLSRSGGKIWQSPRIKSWYHPRNSLFALFRQYTQYGYWKVRVIQKHKLPASWRHLVPGGFLMLLSCLLLTAALGSFRGYSLLLCWAPLILVLGCYGAGILAASMATAARTEWRLLPVLPLVFPCYHFGYGYGFLRGIWDFVALRKRAGEQFGQLTRQPVHSGRVSK
jgi:glycosyltransferase involved in cell wall biosynthesis